MNLETDKISMYAHFLLHVSDGLFTQGLNGTCTETGTKLCLYFGINRSRSRYRLSSVCWNPKKPVWGNILKLCGKNSGNCNIWCRTITTMKHHVAQYRCRPIQVPSQTGSAVRSTFRIVCLRLTRIQNDTRNNSPLHAQMHGVNLT